MDKTGKCVFFDRDGVVNVSPGPGRYVTRWEDFNLMPGFVDSLRIAVNRGYHAVIITNQRAIAKGLMTIEQLEDIHDRLKGLLAANYSLRLLDIAYCPHEKNKCSCRKPEPGMILAMGKKHGINLKASWMIGDAETDIEAGIRAGCRTILIGPEISETKADIQTSSMGDLPVVLDSVL